MKRIDVYSRRGCHLCEQLIDDLLERTAGRLEIRVLDVDGREDWRLSYGDRVPVVEYDGEVVCQYHLDPEALDRILTRLPA